MASDKRKGASKAQTTATSAKLGLKQKTLFDSFISKNPPKNPPAQLLPTDIEADLGSSGSASKPSEHNDAPTNQTSTTDMGLDETSEGIEIDDGPSILDTSASESNMTRSPSIVIIEDLPRTLPKNTGSSTSRRVEALAEGKTKEKPIILVSSPIKAPSSHVQPNKRNHPFFDVKQKLAPTRSSAPSDTKVNRKLVVVTDELPPFPDKFSQHVKGPQMSVEETHRPLPNRPARFASFPIAEPNIYDFLKRATSEYDEVFPSRIRQPCSTSNVEDLFSVLKVATSTHAAIARIANLNPEDRPVSRRPWSEKWRPSCAQEVLGNEQSAVYLRDWLRALELQLEDNTIPLVPDPPDDNKKSKGKVKAPMRGTKRPRIVRAVDKSRRKRMRLNSDDEEDNWIVHTDEEEELDEIDYADLDALLLDIPPSSPSSSTYDLPPTPLVEEPDLQISPNLGQLHNTILLSGPSGSGKTASVYACAEELGWDVFEVYPGIGRRSGVNLDNLIGEVGKNHLVVQNRPSGDVLKSSLKAKAKNTEEQEKTPDILSSYSPRKKSSGVLPQEIIDSKSTVRQSLILLEEVDILFKEDTNFWTTVTRIIKECKRPVICTCNDISLVPIQDLPLQSILYFTPSPSDVAAFYLQALCAAEGHIFDRNELSRLYNGLMLSSRNLLDGSPRLHVPDLRGTINTLQLTCSHREAPTLQECASGESKVDLDNASSSEAPRISMRRSEFLSYLDSSFLEDISQVVSATELANHLPSDDDEIGHIILRDQHAKDATALGDYDRQKEMVTAAIQLSRGLFDIHVGRDTSEIQGSEENKRRIISEQMVAVNEVCPRTIWPSRTDGTPWMDYMPTIRQIVDAEDKQEIEEQEKRPRGGRLTRNSSRRGFVRVLELTDEGRRGVLMSGYGSVSGA